MIMQYQNQHNLDVYDANNCQTLATQLAAGRYLEILGQTNQAIAIRSCEDDYPGWLKGEAITALQVATTNYSPVHLTQDEITRKLSTVIAFTKAALAQPNYYLWGGTLGPNYDCSGLIQAAFRSAGVWLPRDSYQQRDFTEPVEELKAGDLVFFGRPKVNHVGLYLGGGDYIHSSGRELGRNGIAIDSLSNPADPIAQGLVEKFCGGGRVVRSFMGKWG